MATSKTSGFLTVEMSTRSSFPKMVEWAEKQVRKRDKIVNDLMGIHYHRVADVPIVTAGAVVNMQKCKVIAIINHHVLVGKGKSICLWRQVEHYKLTVDDKSRKVSRN